MIDLWTWPTPNGQKVHIALEELALPYKLVPINIGKGEQFAPEFLAINPNHRIPAIIDHDGPGGVPLRLFESGAILIYLAEKSGKLMPADPAARYLCLQWLMFQMSAIGPMFGQYNHFANYAPEKIPYAIERYGNEAARLVRVMEKRLAEAEYLAGEDYSIADIATFPWIRSASMRGGISLDEAPGLKRWFQTIDARDGVQRGVAVMAESQQPVQMTDEAREALFGKIQHAVR